MKRDSVRYSDGDIIGTWWGYVYIYTVYTPWNMRWLRYNQSNTNNMTWFRWDTHNIYIYMMWWTILQGEGVKSDMPVYSQTSPWAQLKRVKSDIPQKVNQNISKQHGHTFRRDLFGIGWFHRILCPHCRKSQYRTMMLKDYNRRI